MQATLNVRMKTPLKERGDKVLREHGISTSAALDLLAGVAAGSLTNHSDDELRSVKMARYKIEGAR